MGNPWATHVFSVSGLLPPNLGHLMGLQREIRGHPVKNTLAAHEQAWISHAQSMEYRH